jgi:hypothetical protein
VVVNEFAANNNTGIQNEKGKYKDWIELFNTTSQPLGLSGLYLSDSAGTLTKWAFPADAFIKPGEHLLVWADDLDETLVDMHTNFNLSNTGDAVILSNASTVLDSVVFGNQPADAAMGRCADGTGSFVTLTTRTPRAVNDCTSGVYEVESAEVQLFPNPASDVLYVTSNEALTAVEVFALSGERVVTSTENLTNVSWLASGSYIVKVTTRENKTWHSKLIKL